ncbi:Leucine-rich repeat-containing protein 4, partial [Galemys pyrenaicus]
AAGIYAAFPKADSSQEHGGNRRRRRHCCCGCCPEVRVPHTFPTGLAHSSHKVPVSAVLSSVTVRLRTVPRTVLVRSSRPQLPRAPDDHTEIRVLGRSSVFPSHPQGGNTLWLPVRQNDRNLLDGHLSGENILETDACDSLRHGHKSVLAEGWRWQVLCVAHPDLSPLTLGQEALAMRSISSMASSSSWPALRAEVAADVEEGGFCGLSASGFHGSSAPVQDWSVPADEKDSSSGSDIREPPQSEGKVRMLPVGDDCKAVQSEDPGLGGLLDVESSVWFILGPRGTQRSADCAACLECCSFGSRWSTHCAGVDSVCSHPLLPPQLAPGLPIALLLQEPVQQGGLQLSKNSIWQIEVGAFRSLASLNPLELLDSWLSSPGAPLSPSCTFHQVPSLTCLDLGELKKLENMSEGAFEGPFSLKDLTVGMCDIQDMLNLVALVGLEELERSGNHFLEIRPGSFHGLSSLKKPRVMKYLVELPLLTMLGIDCTFCGQPGGLGSTYTQCHLLWLLSCSLHMRGRYLDIPRDLHISQGWVAELKCWAPPCPLRSGCCPMGQPQPHPLPSKGLRAQLCHLELLPRAALGHRVHTCTMTKATPTPWLTSVSWRSPEVTTHKDKPVTPTSPGHQSCAPPISQGSVRPAVPPSRCSTHDRPQGQDADQPDDVLKTTKVIPGCFVAVTLLADAMWFVFHNFASGTSRGAHAQQPGELRSSRWMKTSVRWPPQQQQQLHQVYQVRCSPAPTGHDLRTTTPTNQHMGHGAENSLGNSLHLTVSAGSEPHTIQTYTTDQVQETQ